MIDWNKYTPPIYDDAYAETKNENAKASDCCELLSCPYCGNEPEYIEGTVAQADAIYCKECPLGVEHHGMSYEALATVWNGLPRAR